MVSTTKKHRAKIQGYLSNPHMSELYSLEELRYTIMVLNLIIRDLAEQAALRQAALDLKALREK